MTRPMARRFAVMFVLAATACGGGEAPTASDHASTPLSTASDGGGSAIDVTTLDVCELVPVAEVAAAVGGTPGNQAPNGHAYPGAESECWYEVTRGSGRMPEVVGIFLYPPSFFADMREDGATDIAGLGDDAFLSPRSDISTVVVLERGVGVVDARAGTPDHARAVAELALARLERP